MKIFLAHFAKLRILAIALLIVGVLFRSTNLDKKIFWLDEAATLFRVSGYAETELIASFSYSRVVSVTELAQFQRLDLEKQKMDIVKNLAIEEPQLSPLYFVILRFWIQWFGHSIWAIRSLSVLISLLIFPALYWLCLELFQSSLIGWVAVGIIAISPFHVLFAQEARPYSLFSLTILLSSAALLRAAKHPNPVNWALYTATIVLGIHSYLLFGMTAIAHAIYISLYEGVINKLQRKKVLINYLVSSVCGLLISLPWLFLVIVNVANIPQLNDTNKSSPGGLGAFRELIGGIRQTFFDFTSDAFSSIHFFSLDINLYLLSKILYPSLNLVFIAIIGYAAHTLYYHSKSTWLYVLLLGGTGALFLALLGKILPRYLVATYLSVEISIAYLIATKLLSTRTKIIKNLFWKGVTTALIVMGIVSCYAIAQADTWWSKGNSQNLQLATLINRSPKPLLISDAIPLELLSLSHYLDQKVSLQIQPQCAFCLNSTAKDQPVAIPKIPIAFRSLFLFHPSEALRNGLEKTYKLSSLKAEKTTFENVWKLEK
ncbi:glycosyltransferase family 39 protein [Phormidesmis sp. 146-33]